MQLPTLTPRTYQLPVWSAFQHGYKRIVQAWPRRSGKDLVNFSMIVSRANMVAGNYYYMFPTRAWAQRALWDNLPEWTGGKRLVDVLCPESLVRKKNNSDYYIDLKNGSRIKIDGTDNLNFVGQGGAMYVLSEFQSHRDEVTSFMAPILREGNATCIYNGTLRGKNNQLWKRLSDNMDRPDWFTQWFTLNDTKTDYWISEKDNLCVNPELVGLISPYTGRPFSNVQDDVDAGEISFAMARQEYLNEAVSYVQGAYYTREIELMEGEGRLTARYDGTTPVFTFWDLGGDKQDSDKTVIIFATINKHANVVEVIDYYESTGHLRGHYFDILKSRGYNYGGHYIPHDGKRSDTFSGEGMAETALRVHGVEMRYIPKTDSVANDIEVTRRGLGSWRIDLNKCQDLFEHLTKYHENEGSGKPCHKPNCSICKGASHGADAARMLEVARDLNLVEPYLQRQTYNIRTQSTILMDDWILA